MQIYVAKGEQQTGPFSREEIDSRLGTGEVSLGDLAWHADLESWAPLREVLKVEPLFVPVDQPPALPMGGTDEGRMFLYIPKGRLVVLSLLTLGIYEMYWIFHNWRFLKRRDGLKIWPFWRAVFGVLFIYPLLKAMATDPQMNRIKQCKFSAGGLAAGWILLMLVGNLLGRSDDPMVSLSGILVSLPSFLFLLPVQSYINEVNETLPKRPEYYGWSGGHIVCVILGILFALLVIVGLTLPDVEA